MSIRSKPLFSRATVAAIALFAALASMGSSPAYSQSSSSGSTLSPGQIQRIVEARGYQLTGPIVRRGRVYFADVVGQEDNAERLVIDARDGRLLRRSPGDPAVRRRVGNPDDWSPVTRFFGALFGPPDDVAPLSPPPASDFYETPKPKASVKRPKIETKQAVQPASVPGDNKPASTIPEATTPSAPPPVAAPPKAASAPSPETATAAPPSAQTPKTSATKLNDVPVAPLE